MNIKEKIKNSVVFKIWEGFILVLVVVAIGMLVHSYFLITPSLLRQYDTVNFIISAIFLTDLILRGILFGKKYLFSVECIIDFLACLDIFSPALKAVRGIKAARMARIARLLRILRMLRIFRGIKAVKYIGKNELELKMFTTFSIFAILAFLSLSIFVSSYVKDKIYGLVSEEYTTFVKAALSNSLLQRREFDVYDFESQLRGFGASRVLLSYDLNIQGKRYTKQFVDKEQILNDYFDDDILTVTVGKNILVFASKKLRYYVNNVEFFILIASLPVLLILIFLIFVVLNKFFNKPMEEILAVMSGMDEAVRFENVDEVSDDVMQRLRSVYNGIVTKYQELAEYCRQLVVYYDGQNNGQDDNPANNG